MKVRLIAVRNRLSGHKGRWTGVSRALKGSAARFAIWLRDSVRGRRRLRFAVLALLLVPPALLATEAFVRAHLSPVHERPNATRVYGRPMVLERGVRLHPELIEEHLERVGYRAATGGEVAIGEYYLGRWGWVIGRRSLRGVGPGRGAGLSAPPSTGSPGSDPGSIPARLNPVPPEPEWITDLSDGGFVVIRLDYSGRITRMEDEEGRPLSRAFLEPELVGRLSGGSAEDRLPLRLVDLPEELIAALLTVEDQRFYQHHGLDFRRIAAAAVANLKVGRVVQGGSTLTQQLAKNLYLSPRRSLDRKLREAALAVTLELRHSKEEILEAYLNEVYLGQDGAVGVHGVGRAAEHFFGKDAGALTLAESALLVALIRAPSLYSPIRNPETAVGRRNLVLGLMREAELISEEDFSEASRAPITLRSRAEPIRSARYFVDFVAADRLGAEEGLVASAPIVTTMDPRLQRAAEDAVSSGLHRLERDFVWLREGEAGEALQAALVAMDPRTGEILAMVGGRDYGTSQFNRAAGARRQPGSAFKPVVALAALARPEDSSDGGGRDEDFAWFGSYSPQPSPRFTLASVLEDAPLQVETPAGLWQPANYDGDYSGHVTLRDALEKSLNVPFARIGMAVGPERIVETARALGIQSPLQPYLSLALGAEEVSPLELTGAFGVLAAGGVRAEIRSLYSDPARRFSPEYRRPGDGSPRLSGEGTSGTSGQRVFEAAETFLVTSALRGAVERGTGRSLRTLGFFGDVAAKSGTTNDFRDGWFVGYTPSLVVGVWVGFDHGKRLELPGAGVALPIFAEFLKEAVGPHGEEGPWGSEGFSYPNGLEMVEVDPGTGLRGGRGCRGEPELFLRGTAPLESCSGTRLDRSLFRRIIDEGGDEAIRLLRRLFGGAGGDSGGLRE